MGFQIHPLPAEKFQHLFDLSDQDLLGHKARKMVVTEHPGIPCRVSLADAELGDTVILLNYTHQTADSPYHASHAIYVRQGVKTAQIAKDEVPAVLRSRLISLRLFDADHMMKDADVVEGTQLCDAISKAFKDPSVAYIHLHFAGAGCFAASVSRSD